MSSVYSAYPSTFLSANASVNLNCMNISQASAESLLNLHQSSQNWAKQLRHDYSTHHAKSQQILEFSYLISQSRAYLATLLSQQNKNRQLSDQCTRAFLNQTVSVQDSHREREYLTYDSFFGIYRADNLSLVDFLDQFLKLYQLALLDIQFTDMPVDEFASLVQMLDPILTICLKRLIRVEEIPSNPTTMVESQAFTLSNYWESRILLQDESEKRELAFYRWFCGHQLWNSVLNFLCAHLENSFGLLQGKQDFEQLSTSIGQTSVLIRGFTSVLWYTMCFPSYLYQNHISPAMEAHSRQQGSLGLSGTQGQDFRHYKAAMTVFYDKLLAKFGKQREDWPSEIYSAFENMQNNELLFHEHHIILSQQKIQLNYESILQRLASEKQNTGMRLSAMDAMRDMRDAKRKRIKNLLN